MIKKKNIRVKNENGNKSLKQIMEKLIEKLFLICASMSIISVVVITLYIFINGTPAIIKIGVFNFIFGLEWSPSSEQFGILAMIASSIVATIGAVIIGVIIGTSTAIFLSEIAPDWMVKIFKPAIELLAGIPSVVYGFFGLIVIVPMISKYLGGVGNSLLAVIIVLSIMILPTIISISENAIRAVPKEYKEGSLAMGATHIQTIFKVIIPSARSGIMAAIVLGAGRAIGETMAVIMIAGNTPLLPTSLLKPVRTMTANIVLEMSYAFGLHQEALFATGVILFIFIMLLNIFINSVINKAGEKYD